MASTTLNDVQTGRSVQVPDDQVEDAFRSGKFSLPPGVQVPVISPEGQPGFVSSEKFGESIDNGFKFLGSEGMKNAEEDAKYGHGLANTAKAFGLGLARPLTLGGSDVVAKSLGVPSEQLKGLAEHQPVANFLGEAAGYAAPLLTGEGEASVGKKLAEKALPVAGEDLTKTAVPSTLEAAEAPTQLAGVNRGNAGEIVNAPPVNTAPVELPPARNSTDQLKGIVNNSPLGLINQTGQAVQGGVESLLGGGTGGRLVGAAARGAVETPFFQASHNITDDVFENKDLTASSILDGVPTAALYGAGLGAGVEGALGLAGKYVPETFNKASNWLRRVSERLTPEGSPVTEDILQHRAAVSRAYDAFNEALKDFHQNAKPEMIEKLLGASNNAERGLAAQEALSGFRQNLEEADYQSPLGQKVKKILDTSKRNLDAATDDAERFQIVDKAKRDINAFRKPIVGSADPRDFLTYEKVNAAGNGLKTFLEKPEVWGQAGIYQQQVNAVLAPAYQARDAFQNVLFKKDKLDANAFRASEGKAKQIVEQGARNTPDYQEKQRVVQAFTERAKNALDELQKNTYEALGKGDIDLNRVRYNLDEIHESQQKAIASKKAALTFKSGGQVKGDPMLGWVHIAGIPGVRPLSEMLGVARGARSEYVAKMAEHAANTSRAIADSADKFLNGKVSTARPAVKLKDLSFGDEAKQGEQPKESFSRLANNIDHLAANPEALQARVSQQIPNIGRHAPNMAAAIQNTVSRTAAYLSQELPRNPNATGIPSLDDKWEPSDSAKASFALKAQAATHPSSCMDALQQGTLVPEQVEALSTCHPELYTKMKTKLTQGLANPKIKLNYTQRQSLSLFLRTPLDPALKNVQSYQQIFMPNPMGSNIPRQHTHNSSGLGKLDFARAASTGLQSAQTRVR
jgi:hypothetical protein